MKEQKETRDHPWTTDQPWAVRGGPRTSPELQGSQVSGGRSLIHAHPAPEKEDI